jgi:hypothetical protein
MPLEVESEIQDDLYFIVFRVHIENWTYLINQYRRYTEGKSRRIIFKSMDV